MELSKLEKHYCINCGDEATMLHHIVPKELGGNDTTNCVWLCDKCHGLIHNIEFGNHTLNHSELIKEGIRKAREKNGGHWGRPDVAEITPEFMEIYDRWKAKEITGLKAAELSGWGTTTFYKLVKQIEGRD